MQLPQLCAVIAALLLQLASGTRGGHQDPEVTTLGTVVTLLEDLLKQSEEDKHTEETQRASEKTLCEQHVASTELAISDFTRESEELTVGIEAANANLVQLREKKTDDDGLINVWQSDKEKSTNTRDGEHSVYGATHMEYTESINAVRAAIATLKKQDYSRSQSLVQSDAQQQFNQNGFRTQLAALQTMAHVPAKAREALALFLQDEDAAVVVGTPAAYAYEFQSGGLIEMLEGLLEKFIDERTTLENEETTKKHAFSLLLADMDASIKQATAANDVRAGSIATHERAVSSDTASLADANEFTTSNEAFLATLKLSCDGKAIDFEQTQKVRAEEIDVIKQAIQLLEGSDVKGHAETYLSAAQRETSRHGRKAFASLRASLSDDGDTERRAHEFLLEQAGRLNSDLLGTLASKILRDDPLAKVRQMIEALVNRLQEEATSEMTHTEWCDGELASEKEKVEQTRAAVDRMTAEIDALDASIAEASALLDEKTSEVATINANLKEADELHTEKEKLSVKTIEEADAASAAVLNAKGMLTKLFEESPYPKGSSDSILALLTQVHASFVSLKVTAEGTKSSDAEDHTSMKQASAQLLAVLDTEIKHLTGTKGTAETSLSGEKVDLEEEQEKLTAGQSSYTAVQADCSNSGISHEERRDRRQQEIQSLQETLRILEGESAALQ